MTALICPRCGRKCSPHDKFCGFCGFNLAAATTTEMPTKTSIRLADVQFNLGMVFFREGKYQEALQIFENVVKQEDANLRAAEMLARTREILEQKT